MLIPENILQKQLCFTCHRHLSVGPIKVYPNRQVKCGRCTEDNDHGVESKLFYTVLKEMLFPCINSLEGCSQQLTLLNMKSHEDSCEENTYACLICRKFEGSAFKLDMHCKRYHTKETLQFADFPINLYLGNHETCYFYRKDNIILFVSFRYEIDLQRIALDINFVGKKYQGEVLQEFTLYTIKNKPIFKTKLIPCSRLGSIQGGGFQIEKSKIIFDKNQDLICKFNVVENQIITMKPNFIEKCSIIDPALDKGIFRYRFNEFSELEHGKDHYIPGINYISNIPLKVSLYIDTHFRVFLEWHKSNDKTVEICTFDATCTLSRGNHILNAYVSETTLENGECLALLRKKLCFVVDPKYGYVKNNSINIEVKVKVYLPKQETSICHRAQIKCECPKCKS